MKVTVFAPYGSKSPEAGLIYLVANFLRDRGANISQLRCNGVFSQCDRDGESGWKRTISSCLTCMHEQKKLAEWGVMRTEELSTFLTPEEVTSSVRWVNSVPANELMEATIDGEALAEFMKGSIAQRFGIPAIDPRNKSHEAFTRRLMLATIRMLDASRRYCTKAEFELALVAGSQNFMARCLLQEAQAAKLTAFSFTPDFNKRCVLVQSCDHTSSYECPLLIDDISELRADVKSWSPELVRLLNELIAYLGVRAVPVAASAAV